MLFNSFAFLVFFPIVVLLYFLLPHRFRWLFLLFASYYFYMNWKPVYAILIFVSTIITWSCGLLLERSKERLTKRAFLATSLILNFGVLITFKYFNFLNETVYAVLDLLNIRWAVPNLDLLLPVGISFYTFQAVGYTIDVYRGTIKAEKHLGIYALFVSFFPQLVAGPIERAKNLLPQFKEKHYVNYARLEDGLKQMIWGFFMKVAVADRLALVVDAAYSNFDTHNGTTLLIATFFFAFQIYCDFAGYSNIAIGAARIMGFNLMTNFRRPYFSTNIGEFWHRWHISLSTWFRDYLYIPLGGNRIRKGRTYLNVFVTFVVSGIWHGANWTFVIWGALHGAYSIIQKIFGIDRLKFNGFGWLRLNMIFWNFILVLIAWVFFRANNVSDSQTILLKIFTQPGIPFREFATSYVYGMIGLGILLTKEITDEFLPGRFRFMQSENSVVAALASSLLIVITLSMGVLDGGQFIYFQF